jgi:hypothetical protein
MSFTERQQKAFDFCADATKQLLTVATAIIAFTITFAKDFVVNVRNSAKIWAYLSWSGYLLSIVCGILTLYALTAQLEPSQPSIHPPSIRKGPSGWSFLQQLFFVIALILTVIFGINATSPGEKKSSEGKASKVDSIFIKPDTITVRVADGFLQNCLCCCPDSCCSVAKKRRPCTPSRRAALIKK